MKQWLFPIKTGIIAILIAILASSNIFQSLQLPHVPTVFATDTGAKTTTTMTAVASNAGDNNGFETTYGTNTPKDTTTQNSAGIESLNSGSAASSNCALPNSSSDQEDFSTFNFSVPSNATIKGIAVAVRGHYDSTSGTNTFCSFLSPDGGTSWTAGQNTSDVNTSDVTNTLGSSSDTWGRTWSPTEFNNTNFKLRVMPLVSSTARDAFIDFMTVTVYYDQPSNAPTLDSPSNAATGVSTSPTFLMTATDPDSDNLSYKVTIYSNSACTSVVQTNDEASSSTGWLGTNTTCSSPASCYTSGMQASFTVQTPLSANTQYWWKASAKDPDGTGTFVDSSACNSFTTALVSVSVADGSVGYGIVPIGTSVNTTASGLNDTQTVTNDGNGAEDFSIKGQNSANWALGVTTGADQYVESFCTTGTGSPDPCDASPTWTALTTNFQALATNVAALGSQKTDFQISMPSSTSTFTQQSADITVQAVAH